MKSKHGRTRDTLWGLKARFRQRPAGKSGPVIRLVGDMPLQSFREAQAQAYQRDTDELLRDIRKANRREPTGVE